MGIDMRHHEIFDPLHIELVETVNVGPRRQRDLGTHSRIWRHDNLVRDLLLQTENQVLQLNDQIIASLGTVVMNAYASMFQIVHQNRVG